MIRLLVADDHAIVREGLARLIGTWDGVELVGVAADGEEAVSRYRDLRPDVVLMDLVMAHEVDGVEATRRIVASDPDARVLVLTSYPDPAHVWAALDAGAIGYVLKFAAAEDVERAVRAAARGESPVDPKVARVLLRRGLEEEQADRTLSPREREVLELVGRGLPNKSIARRLGITERTVKGHLTNIYRRIGVTDRLQAALVARDRLAGAGGPGGAGSVRPGGSAEGLIAGDTPDA